MKVNEILRAIRRQKDLKLQNVADEIGVSYSTYHGYEKEESKIQVETLNTIAKFYGLTLLELLSFEEKGDNQNVLEPYVPYIRANQRLKVIVELDGSDTILEFWYKKLQSINTALLPKAL